MSNVNSRCPIAGCRRSRKQQQCMCAPHWYQVPNTLRTRIWNLFANPITRGGEAHRALVFQAIQSVHQFNEKLVRKNLP